MDTPITHNGLLTPWTVLHIHSVAHSKQSVIKIHVDLIVPQEYLS